MRKRNIAYQIERNHAEVLERIREHHGRRVYDAVRRSVRRGSTPARALTNYWNDILRLEQEDKLKHPERYAMPL